MAKTVTMRGLKVFIADIRNCKNREEEEQRVDKELANIRSKFKSDKSLTEYEKKKYVWKLLYIHMLGYDVEFGHVQAIDLMSAQKYTEKQVGYMVTSVLVNENNDFLRLSINAVRNDIVSRNESFQCLGLAFAANVAGPEFSEALASETMKLLVSNTSRPIIKKKSALCLLRLFRKNPDIVSPDTWATKMAALLEERDISIMGACVSLLTALAARDPSGYEACVPKLVSALDRLVRVKTVSQDHTYYGIPSPWSQIRLMRCLQYFPPPTDSDLVQTLMNALKSILSGTEVVKNVNKNNASHAILFEAMALAMHLDYDPELLQQCMGSLGKYISVKEPNIRFLGLENMCKLALVPDCLPTIRSHLKAITASLKDSDISIRRRALDLLFTMCDQSTARDIVSELLAYLRAADFAMREELALKIAILAEKFAPDLMWYVDVAMGLVETAGEHISEDVWFRVVQLVTNHPDMQEHAVRHMHDALLRGATAEPLIQTAAYIIGEFSRLVPDIQPATAYNLLADKLPLVSDQTKGIILSAFAKMSLHCNDGQVKQQIKETFQKYKGFVDSELQQRAIEYSVLSDMANMRESVLGLMPSYPERESSLLRRLADATATPTDETTTSRIKSSDGLTTSDDLRRAVRAQAGNGAADLIEGLGISDNLAPGSAPSKPTVLSDPLSDLMSLSVPTAPVAVQAPASNDPFRGVNDLMSGGPSVLDSGRPIVPLGDIRLWYRNLTVSQQGVLYEDDYLQIGVKQEYRPPEGRLTLFLGNKSQNLLDNFQLHVAPSAMFRAQLTSPVPGTLGPKTQQQAVIMVGALGPALDPPTLSLRYQLGAQQVNQLLPLPTVNCKFMIPITNLGGPEFFSAWQAIAGPPMKLQEVISRPHPMPAAQVAEFLSRLNFGVLPGLDPNPNNVVAAANYSVQGPYSPVCMCRIEVEPNSKQQLRVTVATGQATLSSTLKELIKQQILAV